MVSPLVQENVPSTSYVNTVWEGDTIERHVQRGIQFHSTYETESFEDELHRQEQINVCVEDVPSSNLQSQFPSQYPDQPQSQAKID
jgi:hypothetical protein